jgi:hypothetical protein
LYVGRHRNVEPEKFQGAIDEVRLHNRALGPSELNLTTAAVLSVEGVAHASVHSILAIPNPVRDGAVTFRAEGVGVSMIAVEVYDLSGREVFASSWMVAPDVPWDLRDSNGDMAANGVYVYVIYARDSDGQTMEERIGKLFVLR